MTEWMDIFVGIQQFDLSHRGGLKNIDNIYFMS